MPVQMWQKRQSNKEDMARIDALKDSVHDYIFDWVDSEHYEHCDDSGLDLSSTPTTWDDRERAMHNQAGIAKAEELLQVAINNGNIFSIFDENRNNKAEAEEKRKLIGCMIGNIVAHKQAQEQSH